MEKWQEERIVLMKTISQEITKATKENFVLKGGTGLLLAHKLDRFSEDMDFDGRKQIDIRYAIEQAAKKCGCNNPEIFFKKDTEVASRYSLHYGGKRDGYNYPLKIDVSFRQKNEINEKDVIKTDGMRIYTAEKIAEQKLNALMGRNKARDIYDINFLLKNNPEVFDEKNLEKLQNIMREKSMDILLATYEADSQRDYILRKTDGAEKILEIDQAIEKIKFNRNKDLIESLLKNHDYKTVFNIYTKTVLNETGQKWTDKTNQLIAEKMLKDKVQPPQVKKALEHSPKPIDNVAVFVRKIENTPEIKAMLRGPGGMRR